MTDNGSIDAFMRHLVGAVYDVNELKHPEGVQGNQPGVKPRSGATPGMGA
jgi:hypothetical protein